MKEGPAAKIRTARDTAGRTPGKSRPGRALLLASVFFLATSCSYPGWVPFVGQRSSVSDLPGEAPARPETTAAATAAPQTVPLPEVPPGMPGAVPAERGETAAYPAPTPAPTSAHAPTAAAPPVYQAPAPTAAYPAPVNQTPVHVAPAHPAAAAQVRTVARDRTPRVASMKDFPDFIPGEEEFQNGNYAASIPGLLAAFYAGHPRAPYYARIIFEHGLDGRPPNPAEARKALQIMTLRYVDAKRYARQGPGSKRALFQATLGLLHYKGLVPGQARDVTRARKWAETAAGSGFTPAMDLSASVICDSGMTSGFLGFGSGPGDCFSWTLKAAEKGDILAMANLSYLYRDGVGTPRDPLRAVSWAHKAATMNPPSPRAQNDMGAYYLLAQAVSPDPTEAGRWFSLAQGRYPLARRNLAKTAGGGAPELETDIDY